MAEGSPRASSSRAASPASPASPRAATSRASPTSPAASPREDERGVNSLEEADDSKLVINVNATSSAEEVRRYEAEARALKQPLRHTDPDTGEFVIYASMNRLMQWLPLMPYDLLTVWSKMPIFRIRLFHDQKTYADHDRSYAEHVFKDGEDLATAVAWWRKRVSQASKGFAVFEGGFDSTGPVYRTEPPVVCVDGTTGEVVADNDAMIGKKKALHVKRKQAEEKWVNKGIMSEELASKIEAAEAIIREKKKRGEEYMIRGGWAPKEKDEVSRHNDHQKFAVAHGH